MKLEDKVLQFASTTTEVTLPLVSVSETGAQYSGDINSFGVSQALEHLLVFCTVNPNRGLQITTSDGVTTTDVGAYEIPDGVRDGRGVYSSAIEISYRTGRGVSRSIEFLSVNGVNLEVKEPIVATPPTNLERPTGKKGIPMVGDLVDILGYQTHARGSIKETESGQRIYVSKDGQHWAPLFDGSENRLVKYGDPFAVLTPDKIDGEELKGPARGEYQGGMRDIIKKTTAFSAKYGDDGKPATKTGRGIKLNTTVAYANAMLIYILDMSTKYSASGPIPQERAAK